MRIKNKYRFGETVYFWSGGNLCAGDVEKMGKDRACNIIYYLEPQCEWFKEDEVFYSVSCAASSGKPVPEAKFESNYLGDPLYAFSDGTFKPRE